jgi:hypothetical protein
VGDGSYSINQTAAKALSTSVNGICALLALALHHRGNIEGGLDTTRWQETPAADALYSSKWLLTYEGSVRGWLGPEHGRLVEGDPFFSALKQTGVSFFNTQAFNKLIDIPGSMNLLGDKLRDKGRTMLPGNVCMARRSMFRYDESYIDAFGESYPAQDFLSRLSRPEPGSADDLETLEL